jgi:hypothetical protein
MVNGFRRGERLSARDHTVRWEKPKASPQWMTRQQYLIYPEALTVGEIKIGGSVLVSTMLNPRTAPSVFSASPAPAGSL